MLTNYNQLFRCLCIILIGQLHLAYVLPFISYLGILDT